MSKISKFMIGALVALGLVGATALPVVATTSEKSTKTTIEPTFEIEADDSDNEAGIWFGQNYLLFGNSLKSRASVNGLMLMAGNTLAVQSDSEYGFIAGNTINFSGDVEKDLFIAGNLITIESGAEIGRDVFITGSEISIETDLNGDLSVAADSVILKGVKVAGNLNLTADKIEFVGDVDVAGAVVYNDDAEVTGSDNLKYGSLEIYHAEDIDEGALLAAAWYSKVLSMIGLFVVMAIICLIAPKLHTKIAHNDTGGRFATCLAIGLGVLVVTPLVALILLITVFASPLAIVALIVWGLMIYLSQGFAGAWVGHMIIEKLFKSKANIFVEAALGIVILGILSMIPTVGGLTGFLGMLLGLGLMVHAVFNRKIDDETKYYVDESKDSKSTAKKTTKAKSSKKK